MTCQWFRLDAGENCIPLLTSHCQGWIGDLVRQRGWAPEVAFLIALAC
jgi:hypothetical protein